MDEEIQHYFRRRYNMAIGLRTAEQVKIQVGAVQDIEEAPEPIMVKGKDLVRGLPITRVMDHLEVASILEKSISSIEHSILQTLEKCPPELSADIYGNGIFLTGGSALLRGLKERLESSTRLPVHIDDFPLHSVSKGIATVLKNPKKYQSVLLN
jgi:rod shape-determining protein MreB